MKKSFSNIPTQSNLSVKLTVPVRAGTGLMWLSVTVDHFSWRNVCTYSTNTQGRDRWESVGCGANILGTFKYIDLSISTDSSITYTALEISAKVTDYNLWEYSLC